MLCLLNRLFELSDLSPRKPFRVVGEQIDGSFELDHEVYLLEAKWERQKSGIDHLYVFHDKVVGKAHITRGLFISINGVTSEAADAITRGKQPCFFGINGHDLMMILQDRTDLVTFLRERVRLFGEGQLFVPFAELGL